MERFSPLASSLAIQNIPGGIVGMNSVKFWVQIMHAFSSFRVSYLLGSLGIVPNFGGVVGSNWMAVGGVTVGSAPG